MGDLGYLVKDAIGKEKFGFGSQIILADKASDAGIGKVAGWATTPLPDVYGHIIAHGAFEESIKKTGITGPKGVQFLIGHDWEKPAGVITKLEYRSKGLWMEADLDLNISWAKDMYHAAKSRGGLSFSVGIRPDRESLEWFEDEAGNEFLIIKKGLLREVSIVANPANSDAIMEWVKSDSEELPEPKLAMNKSQWASCASRSLPVSADQGWNEKSAREELMEVAAFGTESADNDLLKRAFLIHDTANLEKRSAFKLQIATISGSRLRINLNALKSASEKLKTIDGIPDGIRARAQDVIDGYNEQFEKAANELTIPKLQALLVDEGWVKNEEAAKGLMEIVKSNIHLFKTEPTVTLSDKLSSVRGSIQRLSAFLKDEKED